MGLGNLLFGKKSNKKSPAKKAGKTTSKGGAAKSTPQTKNSNASRSTQTTARTNASTGKGLPQAKNSNASRSTQTTAKRNTQPAKNAPQSKSNNESRSTQTSARRNAPPTKSTPQAKNRNASRTTSSPARKSIPQGVMGNLALLDLVPVQIKDHRDKNGGHHHVIVDDIDDKHVSVGLTTSRRKGKNATNYECKISPLGDGKLSFMRRQAQVAPRSEYYNPRQGNMEKNDYERAKVYGERAKQKYINEKEQEKSNEVPNA